MNYNTGAVVILALLLLGPLAGADSTNEEYSEDHQDQGVANVYDGDQNDDDGICGMNQRPPKVTINAHFPVYKANFQKSYGEDIILHCSDKDSTNLEFKLNGQSVPFNVLNSTTIQLNFGQPNMDYYTFSCTGYNGCEYSLTVEVSLKISVNSSWIHYDPLTAEHRYFVPIGEDYEVLCSGNDVSNLQIEVDGNKLETKILNSSTIQHIAHADVAETKFYNCRSPATMKNKGETVNWVLVVVDYYPDITQFWCYIENWIRFRCSWNYVGDIDKFKLLYTVHEDKDSILACNEKSRYSIDACVWDLDLQSYRLHFISHKNISLTLVVCNKFVCNNQTYALKPSAIIRLNAIPQITVVSTSSRDALLEWDSRVTGHSAYNPEYWSHVACINCSYIILYRLLSFQETWRKADTSALRCDRRVCKFKLVLPFSNSEYVAAIYVRLIEVKDDRLWSNPATVVVTTQQDEECKCAVPQTEEPTTDQATCEFCTLKKDVTKESFALKDKLHSSLKEKRAKITELGSLLALRKDINNKINNVL